MKIDPQHSTQLSTTQVNSIAQQLVNNMLNNESVEPALNAASKFEAVTTLIV